MIKVTYYLDASVAIATPDISILCDPVELHGEHDIIYVSNVDCYDPVFLIKYLTEYPNTKIMIESGVRLGGLMDSDGIAYITPKDVTSFDSFSGLPMYNNHLIKMGVPLEYTVNFKGRNTRQYNVIAIDSGLLVKYFCGEREHVVIVGDEGKLADLFGFAVVIKGG